MGNISYINIQNEHHYIIGHDLPEFYYIVIQNHSISKKPQIIELINKGGSMFSKKAFSILSFIFLLVALATAANSGSSVDAIIIDEAISDGGATFRGASGPICFQHVPCIQETSPGKFVCTWYCSYECDEEELLAACSYNHGNGWSDPTIIAPQCYNIALYQPKRDKDAPLYLYSRFAITADGWVMVSHDEGVHWEPAGKPDQRFEIWNEPGAPHAPDECGNEGEVQYCWGTLLPEKLNGCPCLPGEYNDKIDQFIGLIKNPALELPNGDAFLGSSADDCGWKAHIEVAPYKNYDGLNPDAGNWDCISNIGTMIQPSFLVLSEDYQTLVATGRGPSPGHNIIAKISTDGGLTWDDHNTPTGAGRRGHCSVTLDNGYHVVCGEVNRDEIHVAISDDADSWTQVLKLQSDETGGAYPVVIQASDRMVHIVYAVFRKNTGAHIRHVVIDPDELVGKSANDGPSVSSQPSNKSGSLNSTVEFSVSASGSGSLYYQWQRHSGNGLWYNLPGRQSSYTTESLKAEMNGWKYRCVISDDDGSTVSEEATLTVEGAMTDAQRGNVINTRNALRVKAAGDNFTLSLPSSTGGFSKMNIYTGNGKQIISKSIIQGTGNEILVNKSALPGAGMYVAKFFWKDNCILSTRLIVNR
ncbi:MAG: hypothetical protein GF401_19455 [Chitinivibrionales bacterium]|nr:hypothetical protein [Chitinivibrionales bacterium]